MTKPRFGRRSATPRYRQARKDAALPKLESKVILTCSEDHGTTVSYPDDGSSTHGALRLVPVKRLLVSDGPSTIDLVEWTGWTAWPHDDPTRLVGTLPPQWPKYAAISHVWAPSADAARLAREADRPLHIRVSKPEPHVISWLGLVQAAVAAHAHRCDYLWLDLLCLNQVSPEDKRLQIMNMAKIYRHASMVIVMPGGVVAAQNFDQPSTWINRAWTFQEVTLGYPCYVLVNWSFPGSFSYFSKLQCAKRVGGIGAIAVAPLWRVVEHGPLKELGVAILAAEDGTSTRQYESKSRVLCLGSDAAPVSALGSVIGAVDTISPSEEDDQNSFRSSAFHDSDERFSNPEWETDETDEDNYSVGSAWESAQALDHSFDGGTTMSSGFPPNLSDSSLDEDTGLGRSAPANSMGDDHTESDMASEAPGNSGPRDQHAVGPALLHFDAEVRYSSVWRSMWLRTSTRAQDLVYSMMHLLDTQIDVKYSRSVEELIFELVDRTRSAPAWLTIGYHIPVRPESGLIPLYPDFSPNLDPTFSFGGTVVPASEIVCNGDFFCSTFYIDIKHSSVTDGHLICAPILDIVEISGHNPGELDVESLSFHEVQLSLSCPPAYTVSTSCHFKGHVGSLAVVVGDHSQAGKLGSTDFSSKPFVFFLGKKTGTWQKTGAGWLTEPLLDLKISAKMKRRHLRVGAGSTNAEPVECNCPNAAKYQPPLDDSENVEDLDDALGEATAYGDERKTSRLVGLGANVNAQLGGIFGTPLLAACCNQNLRIVELLLVSGADANMPAQVHLTELDPTGQWYGTPLQSACLLGLNAVALTLIVKGGADVNANVGPEGSALQAVVRGDYNRALVQLLLDHGANANAASGIYGTPLMAMFHSFDPPPTELAELLVKHGAHVNSTAGKFITEGGWLCRSALQMACRYSDVKMVRALLALGADVNLRSGGSFATALQEAANCGESLMCEILLDNGADVNAEGGCFHDTLQAAVAGFLHGKASRVSGIGDYIVQLLIDRGADVNAKGGYYGSALLAAEAIGKYPISQLLLDNGATLDGIPAGRPELHVGEGCKWLPDTLHFASNLGRVEVVEVLLERVLPIDRDADGRTALHLASAKGHVQVAHALLRAGADVLAVDRWGYTPLHLAASSGYVRLVQLFLDNGSDPTMVDKEGGYAATAAAFGSHYSVMTLILDRIADSDARQRVLGKILLTLTEEGCYPALPLLVGSYQFDIAAMDPQGRNAAHLAAQTGRLDILELLFSRGLSPYAFDRRQDGLLHYAARSSSVDMVRRALPFSTDASTRSGGWSPLHWASRNGDVAMVRLLLESGLHETTVVTTTPPGQWTPYAIAVFHQNSALLSALEADTELAANLGRLGLTTSTAVGPGQRYHEHQCDGCWLDIYGSRFHCITCDDFDYCFMCKADAHITHPNHDFEALTWEFIPIQRHSDAAIPQDHIGWQVDSDSDDEWGAKSC